MVRVIRMTRGEPNSKELFVFLSQLWKLYKASCPDPPYNKEVRKSTDWHYVSWVEGFLEPAGSHKNNSINLWSMFNMPHGERLKYLNHPILTKFAI